MNYICMWGPVPRSWLRSAMREHVFQVCAEPMLVQETRSNLCFVTELFVHKPGVLGMVGSTQLHVVYVPW
jgi:hypothetical protein